MVNVEGSHLARSNRMWTNSRGLPFPFLRPQTSTWGWSCIVVHLSINAWSYSNVTPPILHRLTSNHKSSLTPMIYFTTIHTLAMDMSGNTLISQKLSASKLGIERWPRCSNPSVSSHLWPRKLIIAKIMKHLEIFSHGYDISAIRSCKKSR